MHEASPHGVSILILAAGSSQRMGSPKQLLPIHGIPLIRHVALQALQTRMSPVVVVLGSMHENIRKVIADLPLSICINSQWESGMASSIQCGLPACFPSKTSVGGVLIMLCDQPGLTCAHLHSLIQLHKEHPDSIIASKYGDQVGTPALFPQGDRERLQQLKGDRGAKPILQNQSHRLLTVKIQEAAFDLDRPEDYSRWIAG